MPLYDYTCKPCLIDFDEVRRIDERHLAVCPKCGKKGELILVAGKGKGFSIFQPGWWHDIQAEPIYINSPQELRNACDRNNSYSHALENGLWKTSPGPDREHL